MQIKKLTKIAEYAIRIEPGEKLVASLEKFMRDVQGGYATFHIPTGGGFTDVECSFTIKGGSEGHKFAGPMELGGAGGNIAWSSENPDTPVVHCHLSLGDKQLKGHIVHLKEATVNLTAEVKIEVYKEKIFRKLDERVNLKLLDLPSGPAEKIKKDNFIWWIIIPLGLIIVWLIVITIILVKKSMGNN